MHTLQNVQYVLMILAALMVRRVKLYNSNVIINTFFMSNVFHNGLNKKNNAHFVVKKSAIKRQNHHTDGFEVALK